jgi:hypothetical protein
MLSSQKNHITNMATGLDSIFLSEDIHTSLLFTFISPTEFLKIYINILKNLGSSLYSSS